MGSQVERKISMAMMREVGNWAKSGQQVLLQTMQIPGSGR